MTNEELKSRYNEFNHKFFFGMLPDIPVTFAKLKGVGGYFSCKVRRKPASLTMVEGTGFIKVSNLFIKGDDKIDGILLHEMIHAYFAVVGQANENHGRRFNTKRKQLSSLSGIDIPLTEKTTGTEEFSEKAAVIEIGVILIEHNDGRYSVALTAPARFKVETDLEALKKQWENRIKFKIIKGVSVWTVKSELWTELAMRMPVQRKSLSKLSLYPIKNIDLIGDLKENGKLIIEV